ncbi:MAG: prolyl oligopeptidase family serine peptidase [Lysobacterales bacterium]|jgi:dipeptidyl aminopeptidase/acylaminoacyl peptidase
MRFLLKILVLCLAQSAAFADEPVQWTANGGQLILQDVPRIPPELVRRLNRYQNVRSAVFLDWAKDGEGIYIRTRFGEISQLHRVRQPGGYRQQLTWYREPVGPVMRRAGEGALSITMDEGGREQDQVFLFDPGTGDTRRLTDGVSRNRLALWSRDGKKLAFQSTRRNGRSNDLWIMNPDRPGSEELLLEAPDGTWFGPADFSRNGRYLLVQRFISVDDSRIYVLDLEERQLYSGAGGGERLSANKALSFDHQGNGFYFITNQRNRAAELAWMPLDGSGEAVYITADSRWDVSDFALSANGKRGAFVTNEDGISQLYLLDTRSNRYRQAKQIPVGVISGLKFSPDSRRLAFNLSTAQTPNDVYVLELGRRAQSAGELRRWTFSEVGGLDTDSFVEPKLVRYPTFDLVGEQRRTVPAFVYSPPGKGPHPVVIHVHGGPEAQYRPSFSKKVQMWLTELGVAVIAPNIRGSSGYDSQYLAADNGLKREDAIRDIGALLDWIATQDDLDEERVAIYGSSYGGYVVLASAVHYSDRLRAGVDVVGISNFVTFLENTEDYRRDFRRLEYGDERDPEMRAFLERISPLNNVDRINIPLLVVQGRNDPRVPAAQSRRIVDALREHGQPVWYIDALNEGHGYDRKENRDIYEQATILFLQQHLAD